MRFENSDFEKPPSEPGAGDRVVVLLESPPQKIAAIKAVRNCTDLGLKAAKELVERAPTPVLSHVTAEEADQLYLRLVEAGARVTVESLGRYDPSELVGVPRTFVLREPAAGCVGAGAGLLIALLALVFVAWHVLSALARV